MGISNQIPNSRLAQPGVCTSTTRPASPFEGQVIYETDTNRVLVYDASAWVMIADTDSPPGMELVKSQTIGTAVASVTVSGAFSADYDNYLITVAGGTASAGGLLQMTLGSTSTGYYSSLIYTAWGNSALASGTSSSVNWPYAGTFLTTNLAAEIYISSPFLSKPTFMRSNWWQTGDTGFHTGLLNNSTSYTAFTLTCNSTHTLTGGTIRVYGYRNS